MNTTIYYFTGTGNSLLAARWLAARLDDCQLVSIAQVWKQDKIVAETETVGVVCPTYYIGPPAIVQDFARKLDVTRARYIFAMPTRGLSVAIGTTWHIRHLLKQKGRDLDLGVYVTMGQNFTPLYRVPSTEQMLGLNRKAQEKIAQIAGWIQARKRRQEYNHSYLLTRWVHPRFMQNINDRDNGFRVDREKCHGCGVCQTVCPVSNIILANDRPAWNHQCQLCLACVMFCPQEAIEYSGSEGTTAGKPRYRNPAIRATDIIQQKQLVGGHLCSTMH